MSVNWLWSEKIGEVVTEYDYGDDDKRQFTTDLYMGNAYLIMIDEDKEKGTYSVNSFFLDKTHMNRCFGLDKKWETYGDNMFDRGYSKWVKVRVSKEYKHYKEFITAVAQAFDKITIEIY